MLWRAQLMFFLHTKLAIVIWLSARNTSIFTRWRIIFHWSNYSCSFSIIHKQIDFLQQENRQCIDLSRRHRLLILQRQDLPSWLFEAEICCVFGNSDPSSSKLWHQATVLAGTTAETMAQSSKTPLPTPTLIVKLQSLWAHAISAQISVAASFYHVLCHATSVLILEV